MTKKHGNKIQIQIIRFPALSQKLGGVSRSSLFRWVRDKKFPAPIKLGENAVGWLEHEVDAWLMQNYQDNNK